MFQDVPELLSVTVVTVGSLNYHTVTYVASLPPLSWDEIVVGILNIYKSVLPRWISDAHQIM